MYYALSQYPHTTAAAAWAFARVGVGLMFSRAPGMALRIDPHPIDRVVSR